MLGRASAFVFALLISAAAILAGCARCASKVEYESFVRVPTELADLEKLDDPPDVVVKVEKKAVTRGGGACGHSPVCIIIIPFVIAEALFPEKVKIATVTEKGKETYHGMFRENGQFVQALALRDGVWKKIAFIQLQELGRNIVVEIEHAPVEADGTPGKFEPSSLQKQVDLLTGYRALLATTNDARRRANIVSEMLAHLQSDALPFAKERLLDGAESPLVKTEALSLICSNKTPIGSADDRAQLTKELGAAKPDRAISAAALACFDPKQPEQAAVFTARLIDDACTLANTENARALAEKIVLWGAETRHDFRKNGQRVRTAIEPFVARCAASERRLFLRFVLQYALRDSELRTLASSKDFQTADAVISELDNTDDDQRAILVGELERADSPLGSLLAALRKNARNPDAAEAKALAGAFIVRAKPGERAEILERLEHTPDDQKGPARARLEQKLAVESGTERAALHASLVMLGDRDHEAGAARGLRGLCPELAAARAKPDSSAEPAPGASAPASAATAGRVDRSEQDCVKKLPTNDYEVKNALGLIAFVLANKGCTRSELLEIAATDPKRSTAEHGRVCKGASP